MIQDHFCSHEDTISGWISGTGVLPFEADACHCLWNINIFVPSNEIMEIHTEPGIKYIIFSIILHTFISALMKPAVSKNFRL